jgi:hypothetical protein
MVGRDSNRTASMPENKPHIAVQTPSVESADQQPGIYDYMSSSATTKRFLHSRVSSFESSPATWFPQPHPGSHTGCTIVAGKVCLP